jgi:leukotriene-A4 hydrolase
VMRTSRLRTALPAVALAMAFVAHSGCSMKPPAETASEPAAEGRQDPHSFARPGEVSIRHLALELDVNFTERRLVGSATLDLQNRANAGRLHLDTDGLEIRSVTDTVSGEALEFSLGEPVEHLGRELVVQLRPATERVRIEYATSPDATAVQWLAPEQTAGRRHPFLFTQSQAILARSWIPLQDTPTVRMTYEAVVRVPRGLLALMSAENPTARSADGVYRFRMPQPIPSYLLALAAGDLEFRALDERTGVYAEPPVMKNAAWEFADTPKKMEVAEKLYGPYRWGRYDILVLPPSFPFGGMENPRLTFATPTIIAGDRSLTALVAHELAHSWSGNLVTNATWNDFWLNEGFTVYFEQRIMEAVYGGEYAEMLAHLGLQELKGEMAELKPRDQHLYLDLAGRDPDDGMNAIAYQKGHFFLRMLENTVGRERWDQFLAGYFDRFAFQSMDTAGFVDYLRKELVRGNAELERRLRIDEWVYGPGLPPNAPRVESARFAAVDAQLRALAAGAPAAELNTQDWTTHEWLHFIRNLPDVVDTPRMAELDKAFGFTRSGNAEILHAWLLRAVERRYEPAYPALERFLTSQGRRKFLRPLYAKLAETPEGREMALRIYRQARPTYHAVSRQAVDDILGHQETTGRLGY